MSSHSTTGAPAPTLVRSTIPSELLYDMFKTNFERTWHVKDVLEEKARSIITVSSAIITLLFGFTTFAVALNLTVQNQFVAGSIALSVIAIGICLRATGVKEFSDALPGQIFDENGSLDNSKIEELTGRDDEDVKELRATLYLAGLVNNRRANNSKAELIWFANAFLFLSMFLVTVAFFLL